MIFSPHTLLLAGAFYTTPIAVSAQGSKKRAISFIQTVNLTINGTLAASDLLQSGPYTIQQCGANAQVVKQDLDILWNILQRAIANVHYGTASPAYQAFFKKSIYNTFIDELLTNITTGAAIPKPRSGTTLPVSPTITCITGANQSFSHLNNINSEANDSDLWKNCSLGKTTPSHHSSTHSSIIFLCPTFFNHFQESARIPNQRICPTVSEGAFAGPGRYLIDTHQVDILLHELVLFYLGNAPSPVAVVTLTETEEVEEMNAAFGLGATRAIGNAPSYVFYVAMVAENCTEYP